MTLTHLPSSSPLPYYTLQRFLLKGVFSFFVGGFCVAFLGGAIVSPSVALANTGNAMVAPSLQAAPVELTSEGLLLYPERLLQGGSLVATLPRYSVKLLPKTQQIQLDFPFADIKPSLPEGYSIGQQGIKTIEFQELKGPLMSLVRVTLTLDEGVPINTARSWQVVDNTRLLLPMGVSVSQTATHHDGGTLQGTQTPSYSPRTTPIKEDRVAIEGLEADTHSLMLRASGKTNNKLTVKSQFYLQSPHRFVLDVQPAQVTKALFNLPENSTTPLPSTGVSQWNGWTVRVSQNQRDIVRVVIETEEPNNFDVLAGNASFPNSLLIQPTKLPSHLKQNLNVFNSRKSSTLSQLRLSKYVAKQPVKVRLEATQPIDYTIQGEKTNRLVLNLANVTAPNEPMAFDVSSFPYLNSLTHVQTAKGSTVIFDAKVPIQDVRSVPLTQENAVELTFLIEEPKPTPQATPTTRVRQSNKPLVVIDAGHGGKDQGTSRNGVLEKDLTLATLKLLKPELEKLGIDVITTRTTDVFLELSEISRISNNAQPNAFVSIHYNASTNPSIAGLETYYFHPHSLPLARAVHQRLAGSLPDKDRGVRQAKFYVINHTQAPSILLELGYVSNDEERNRLVNPARQKQAAEAVAKGVLEFLKAIGAAK